MLFFSDHIMPASFIHEHTTGTIHNVSTNTITDAWTEPPYDETHYGATTTMTAAATKYALHPAASPYSTLASIKMKDSAFQSPTNVLPRIIRMIVIGCVAAMVKRMIMHVKL